ncbi:murein biosynthesis integral membrane protein MurJ [Pseudorhodoplanes sinuspersici]|nr:murein biosynthesis integral membrane protein MurJ [Pseudorhodoplanes sinuspersici]RKE69079.1 putative peptidoglycan lipid II flippase [Pseudorhodoplanes sinuspersici]
MSIARNVAIVGAATLASRVLGFVRDVAIAGLFGAGARADAFVVAFQFSNLVRRLLTEGALNSAFVPLYLRRRDEGGEKSAGAYAGKLIGTLTLVLLCVSALLALAMPLLMIGLAPGFGGHDPRMTLAVEMARLMLPYLVLAGPIAVLMGVLNANHRYSTAAAAAVMFNIVILIAIAVIVLMKWGDSDRSAWLVAIAVALAGLCQLVLVGITVLIGPEKATPLGVLPRNDAQRFVALAIPGLIASGVPQLTMIVAVMIASDWPGAVSWLYYANRLVELPLGIVGIAIGTVMTPALSHAARGKDRELGPRTIRHGIEMALGLAFPAAIALMLLAWPIVHILFERGAFTSTDSYATATMLGLLAIGLPGHVLVKALSPVFFAHEDTRTPMMAAGVGLIAAFFGSLAFMLAARPSGIALSIAASGWISAAMLWLLATRRGLLTIPVSAWRRLALIALSAAIMGAVVRLVAAQASLFAQGDGRLLQIALLTVVVGVGLLVYAACLWLFDIVRTSDLRTTFRPR